MGNGPPKPAVGGIVRVGHAAAIAVNFAGRKAGSKKGDWLLRARLSGECVGFVDY